MYEELADSFASNKKINIAKVDGDAHKDLSQKFGIGGFPTIKFFDGTSKDPVDYNGGRDLESLQAYVQEKTGARAKKASKPPSAVLHLNDRDFKSAIGGDQGVFVAFTAPWCGRTSSPLPHPPPRHSRPTDCKTLAPVWEDLASDFSGDASIVKIAKVDAEANKAVASEYAISSYPTIKYFPRGSTEPLAYSSGRDLASLVAYVNEHAGTHRVAGGALDAAAGTVAALDAIVAKLSGSNLAQIQKEVGKAAASLQDRYAAYYVKVLAKLADNKAYVEKEAARLSNIAQKGGLAREKSDDVSSRLNILKKFVPGAATEEKQEL